MKKLTLLALFIAASAVAVIAQTAAKTTDDFYAKLAEMNIRGLPDAAQLTAISPFVSNEVISLIKRDQKKQAAFIKKHPDEKPPWIEGDLFSSLFEGRTSYKVGNARLAAGGPTYVDVNLEYTGDGNTTKWTDTVVLKKTGGKWRITNILFKGKWQFKNGSSLLNVLK